MKLTERKLRKLIREELHTYQPPRETLGEQNKVRWKLYEFIESLEERYDREEVIKTTAKTIWDAVPREYLQDVVNEIRSNG